MSTRCRFCGGRVFADASDCKHCGKVLKQGGDPESEKSGSLTNLNSWDKSIPSWVMYLVVAFFLGCLVLLFVKGCQETQPLAEPDVTKANVDSSAISAPIEIPFVFTEFNNISVKAVVNEVNSVKLMFHTGNSNLCLTRDAVAAMKGLNLDQKADVKSWGGNSQTQFGSGNSLKIGELSWDDVTIFVDTHSGRLTDGKFGPDLFPDKVIEVDFEKKKLILHSALPEIASDFEKLNCELKDGIIFVEGALQVGERLIENEFMIHSGFGGTALLDDEFVANHAIGSRLETLSESELKDSFGNVLKTKSVLLPKLKLGQSEFANLPIGIFDGAIGRQKMSVLGGEILRRFNLILDLENSHLYLQPNSSFDQAFKKG